MGLAVLWARGARDKIQANEHDAPAADWAEGISLLGIRRLLTGTGVRKRLLIICAALPVGLILIKQRPAGRREQPVPPFDGSPTRRCRWSLGCPFQPTAGGPPRRQAVGVDRRRQPFHGQSRRQDQGHRADRPPARSGHPGRGQDQGRDISVRQLAGHHCRRSDRLRIPGGTGHQVHELRGALRRPRRRGPVHRPPGNQDRGQPALRWLQDRPSVHQDHQSH